jgi:hypothetical protein
MARLPLTLDDWGKKRVNNLTVTPPIILFFGIVRDKINTHKRKCGGGGITIIRIQLLRSTREIMGCVGKYLYDM